MERLLVKFVGSSKSCDQNGDRVSRNNKKLPYLHLVTKKVVLVDYEKMGLCILVCQFLFLMSKVFVLFSVPYFCLFFVPCVTVQLFGRLYLCVLVLK